MTADAGSGDAPGESLYRAAGVDLDANDRLIPRYRDLALTATRPEVIGGVGAFSGLFDLSGYTNPVLVASTDSVGTKVLLARMLRRFDGVGRDIVNHSINDILTAGARPLFLLDYLAGNGLSEDDKVAIVGGVAAACREAEMALLGGETADMPGVYRSGDFDLAATIIGVVEKGRQIDGSEIVPGDVLLGLPSTGLHTNGYTLARRSLGLDRESDRAVATLTAAQPELGESLADALLRPHRAYWPLAVPALPDCKGIAHITGGGIPGNLVRVLPRGTRALVRRGAWAEPPIFDLIQRLGEVDDAEMFRVFNMGVGLILVVQAGIAGSVRDAVPEARMIGEIVSSEGEPSVQIEV